MSGEDRWGGGEEVPAGSCRESRMKTNLKPDHAGGIITEPIASCSIEIGTCALKKDTCSVRMGLLFK